MLAVVNLSSAQQITTLKFDKVEHDFGDIDETKGEVYTSFKYENVGSKPLVIYSVNTTCGCTTPVFSREPLMPSESEDRKSTRLNSSH